jgi:hypothetical protein
VDSATSRNMDYSRLGLHMSEECLRDTVDPRGPKGK